MEQMRQLSLYWDTGGDVEDIRRYLIGGFHPICLGDVISSQKGQYRILNKLGQGSFSTVWLAETLQEPSHGHGYVALKICVADADPNHELELFNRLSRTTPVPPNVVQLLDHFPVEGPNGVHTVLVQNVLERSMDIVRSPNGRGRKHVRSLCRDITLGLAALHRQGIVHGGFLDLHPGNIGIYLPSFNNHPPSDILDYFNHPECTMVLPTTHPTQPGVLPPYLVESISVIDYMISNDKNMLDEPSPGADHGFGKWSVFEKIQLCIVKSISVIANEQTHPACTQTEVCAPELMFKYVVLQTYPGSPPTRASDIWSLACTIFELVFGGAIFYFELGRNDTLLGKMAMLCGEVPQGWKEYWESRERLHGLSISQETANAEWNSRQKHLTTISSGHHEEGDVQELFTLLRSMLIMDPIRRPSAEEVLKHSWFTRGGTA